MEDYISQMKQDEIKQDVKGASVLSSKKKPKIYAPSDNFSTATFPRSLKIERQKACEFSEIRRGAKGTYDVVMQMKRVVRTTSVNDKGFEQFAVSKILLANGFDSHTQPQDQLKAVFDFVISHIKYISDVKGIEDIKDARTTLSDGYGDCDDIAIFIASMLSVLGFEPLFVVARTPRLQRKNQNSDYVQVLPKDFNHVYVCVDLPDGRFYLDATLEMPAFNVQANSVRERRVVKIWNDGNDSYVEGLEGIGDFFKTVLKVATPFVSAIPVIGQIASVGLGALNAAVNKPIVDFSVLATETNKVLDELIVAVRDKGADYSEAVHQGEAVVNNFIGLKNNKGKKQDAQTNETLLQSVTAKLNQLRSLLDLYNSRLNAKSVNVTTDASGNVTAMDAPNYLLYAGIGIGVIALIYFVKD